MDRWQLITSAGMALVGLSLVALLVAHNHSFAPRVHDSDDHFLEAYEAGRTLLESVGDERPPIDDEHADLYVDQLLVRAAWTDRWVPDALALGAAGGESGAVGEALLLEGKALFGEYRAAHTRLLEGVVDERDDALGGQESAVVRTAAFAVAVAIATSTFSLWRGRRLRLVVHDSRCSASPGRSPAASTCAT